jgi:hypothetical protein
MQRGKEMKSHESIESLYNDNSGSFHHWLLGCLTFSAPRAFGVVPPPDGGYPGFNTAEGTDALRNLTPDVADTAVGWHSLYSNTDGSFNTATGAGTLLFNTGDENTAFGAAVLLFNTTPEGNLNTAIGAGALVNNIDGNSNTATDAQALQDNATGGSNTATGRSVLMNNTTGLAALFPVSFHSQIEVCDFL